MGSPAAGSVSGSPYSPVSSPLLQKAVGGGFNGSRRQSYGSASPLGLGVSRGSTFEAPSTPTPAGSKSSNVTLNSKWLYDKGRRNSGNVKLF
jgi:nucleoporin POM34